MSVNRDRELAVRLRMQRRLEQKYLARYYKIINDAAKAAGSAFAKKGSAKDAVDAAKKMSKDLTKVIIQNVTEAGKWGFDHVQELYQPKKESLSFQDLIQNYVKEHALEHVKSVTDTTIEMIRSAIADGEEEGLAVNSISKRIVGETGGAIARNRAYTIAITETHSAASYASQEAAKATGLELRKQWISTEDGRTRQSHLEADGQTRKMSEKYIVGTSRLEYPGDPSGDPSETVRCRCIEIYLEKNGS